MTMTRLQQLSELGQSVWIDFLSRDLLREGGLAEMMEKDAVVGVTSNPTIFQKAIGQGVAYDEQLKGLAGKVVDPKELFLELSAQDVAEACDLLRPVFDATHGVTGTSRGRSTPPWRTTVIAPTTRRSGSTRGSTGRTST